MDNSVLIAKFLGPFMVLIGISVIFNIKTYTQVIEGFLKNAALIYVTGLTTFLMGLAIILFHNVWTVDWRIIITIFGWLTLIKGTWLIVLPGTIYKITPAFAKDLKMAVIPWVVMLAIGIFLILKAY